MTKKKSVAIVQARLGSTRLPYKMLLSLHGKPIIEWVLKRVNKSKLIDDIIVAIPSSEDNNILEKYIVDYESVKECKPDNIVRVCADNPLIDGNEIDNLINFYNNNKCNYAYNHIPKNNLYPDGLGSEILSFELLKWLNDNVTSQHHKEHCLSYITDNQDKFSIKTFNPLDNILHRPDLKFDVDTFDDYYKLAMKDFDINVSSHQLIKIFTEK